MPKTILLFLITGGFLVSNLVCQAKQYKGKVHGDYKLSPRSQKKLPKIKRESPGASLAGGQIEIDERGGSVPSVPILPTTTS